MVTMCYDECLYFLHLVFMKLCILRQFPVSPVLSPWQALFSLLTWVGLRFFMLGGTRQCSSFCVWLAALCAVLQLHSCYCQVIGLFFPPGLQHLPPCTCASLSFSVWKWTFRFLPCLGCCVWCCDHLTSAAVSFRAWFQFLWIILRARTPRS